MIYLNDVGGDGLGKPRRGFKKFLKVAKIAVAPHTLLQKKRNRKPIAVAAPANNVYTADVETVENVDSGEIGLGKAKFKKVLKKVKLKTVVKQVGKVAKFAAPIAAGFIPIAGGTVSKVLDSKIGKTAMKLGKSKVGSVVLSQAGINLPDSKPKTEVVSVTDKDGNKTAPLIPVKKKKRGAKILQKKKPIATPQKSVAASPKPKGKSPLKFKKKSKKLAIGSKGEDVKALQEQLGIKPDGDFGPKTQQALEQATGQTSISTEDVQAPAQTLAIGSQGEGVKELQEQLGIKPDGIFGVKTQQALEQATGQRKISTRAIQTQPMDEAEPQGELTPIKPYEESLETQAASPTTAAAQGAPKNNTILYVGGAVALAGIAYLATRKK
ncbi:peptidoglycan-binding domain-containing protein [Flavobacterium laiguense]|uniref:Peptidoglycan binding-like domain-containing protein n=1 Tax=Flavobacterium laiguense TaxID=2169409 RepID=A0A2U1JWL8_9FLAO|nr:peptidoglycan-binding domain-containing protein [Flavobacterium laiguense]PWA09522.1 hypothetical protein DB891_07515 [Flavobacterium laiguense]